MGEMEQMLRMMEKSLAKKAELRPDLIPPIEEFCSMYHSLFQRYHHLRDQLNELSTPDQKVPSRRAGSVSSPDAVSDVSFKEGSESPSSSDSESDSFSSSGNAYFSLPPINTLHKKIELGSDLPHKLHWNEQDDDVERNDKYEDLIGRITKYEEELRVTKDKLQLSEDEIARLKMELQTAEFCVQDLQTQLETAKGDVKVREADVEAEKRRAFEVEQTALEVTNELNARLELAQEEIAMSKDKLDSQTNQLFDLLERIDQHEKTVSDRDNEIRALKVEQLDVQEKFSLEKANMRSEISILTEKQNSLEVRLEEWELQGRSMEDKLRQSEVLKMEMKGLQEELVEEINQLKVELADRGGHVEALNKQLDHLKFEYDMLMEQKDGMGAKINSLLAEVGCRDDKMRQKDEQMQHMHMERKELSDVAEEARREVNELRSRVMEMEKEVDRQRVEIIAGAEEKREAIRQLCFSLDHYRSGYKQLCRVFVSHKRHTVSAS